jgi:YD repeat-containing protein
MLQLTNITVSGSRSMNMTYNYPANNNGRIASSVDAVNSQTVNYTYDSLNRLTAAQASNNGWGEAYTYDGFGNLQAISPTGQGGETWSAAINESTNRLQGVNYDSNGNQIGDQVYTNYVWNVENRMVQQLTAGSGGTWYGGTGWSYDPSGRRVMKNVNPAFM